VVAVDQSPRMVELTAARGVDALVGDVQELGFPTRSFDAAVANFMLYHVPDLDRGLSELARVLRPGGVLVAATNSVRQLAEMWELVGRDLSDRADLFSRETGEPILRRHFRAVRRIDLDSTIALSASEMRHYIAHSVRHRHLAGRVPEFAGTLTVTTGSCVFVATTYLARYSTGVESRRLRECAPMTPERRTVKHSSPALDETCRVRKDTIRMCPSDPSWAASFEHQRERLTSVLEPWLVQPLEHIGSTAVPGLVAKPIIDMLAVVEDIDDAEAAVGPLREIGWLLAPEPGDELKRSRSFCTPSIELRTHHLHVAERSSVAWHGWLAFRDHLRTHPDVSREYGALKTRLANEHGADPNQRDAYRSGKADWVQAVTARALSVRTDEPPRPESTSR
jgi:GrpB-like predicted nucleotidyltransferase (UPF0157 family)